MDWNDKLTYGPGAWSKDKLTASASDVIWLNNLKADKAVELLKVQATEITALKTAVAKLTAPVTPTIDYAKLAAALLAAVKEN
jgi:hypothetical protein